MKTSVPVFCAWFSLFETWYNQTCLVGVNGIEQLYLLHKMLILGLDTLGFIGSQLLGSRFFFPVLSDFAFYLGFYLSMAEHLHPIP